MGWGVCGGLTLSAKHSHIFQQMGYEFDVVMVVYVVGGRVDVAGEAPCLCCALTL